MRLMAELHRKGTRSLRQTEQPPRVGRRCNSYVFDAYAAHLGDLTGGLDYVGRLIALATPDLRRAIGRVCLDDERIERQRGSNLSQLRGLGVGDRRVDGDQEAALDVALRRLDVVRVVVQHAQ